MNIYCSFVFSSIIYEFDMSSHLYCFKNIFIKKIINKIQYIFQIFLNLLYKKMDQIKDKLTKFDSKIQKYNEKKYLLLKKYPKYHMDSSD